jgi:predicted transcriptional regulator
MTNEPMHPDLIREIHAARASVGMTKADFGHGAMGDRSFITRLEAGRECRRATLAKVRAFIASLTEMPRACPPHARGTGADVSLQTAAPTKISKTMQKETA